ncbi:hypothetical protein AMTR_s00066p00166820 [Amborella trichopoda]|uniref:Cytochrome P450 n=1 Tax=Amborella trichopoda TaxID=13333 RepID=U5DI70_AMBTC|nr:hypothetical protein AMTR_s00066p00166820 [Amborella trichopoda]
MHGTYIKTLTRSPSLQVFMGTAVDVRSQDFRFIPFSAGRRICPGIEVLASLLHGFEWQREGIEPVDKSEGVGLTMPRAVPLKAFAYII